MPLVLIPPPPPLLLGQRVRPETPPFHGGVKLAEFRGSPGIYERISGNRDAPFGALTPILRIRLCGPICATKPSVQSLVACLCRCSSTIPFRPETAPFHGGVKLAEFRGFLGVYERISGNRDAPFGALAPILRIRLCGPICTTKPSAQSLLFLCSRAWTAAVPTVPRSFRRRTAERSAWKKVWPAVGVLFDPLQ